LRAAIFVIPAQAENQLSVEFWVPACAGMTTLEIGKLILEYSVVPLDPNSFICLIVKLAAFVRAINAHRIDHDVFFSDADDQRFPSEWIESRVLSPRQFAQQWLIRNPIRKLILKSVQQANTANTSQPSIVGKSKLEKC
jgi:hypothetical protein